MSIKSFLFRDNEYKQADKLDRDMQTHREPDGGTRKLSDNISVGLTHAYENIGANVLWCCPETQDCYRAFSFIDCNILRAESSFICVDIKGERQHEVATAVQDLGYRIRTLDLIDLDKSNCFNVFNYITRLSDCKLAAQALLSLYIEKQDIPFGDPKSQFLNEVLDTVNAALAYEWLLNKENGNIITAVKRLADLNSLTAEIEASELTHKDSVLHIFNNISQNHCNEALSILKWLFTIPERILTHDDMDIVNIGNGWNGIYVNLSDCDSTFYPIAELFFFCYFQCVHSPTLMKTSFRHVHLYFNEYIGIACSDWMTKYILVSAVTMRNLNMSCSVYMSMGQLFKVCASNAFIENQMFAAFDIRIITGDFNKTDLTTKALLNSPNFQKLTLINSGFETAATKGLDRDEVFIQIRGKDPVKDRCIQSFFHKSSDARE